MSSSDLYTSRDRGAYDRGWSPDGATEGPRGWFGRAEGWLDDRGKGAWVALTILAFVFAWPVGLALLAYTIWSKRMFSHNHGGRGMMCGWKGDRQGRDWGAMSARREARMDAWRGARAAMRPSGNAAFDAYKTDTLRRLEEEQQQFEEFLGRLREAKDKAEFDQFMEDRARRADDRSPQGREGREGDEPSPL